MSKVCKAVGALVVQFCLVTFADAQAVHLVPVPRQTISGPLLTITNTAARGNNLFRTEGVRIRINEGVMYVYTPAAIERVEMGDRTIGEFIDYFRPKYPGVTLVSDYPEIKVSELAEGTFTFLRNSVSIGGHGGRPSIDAALGIGFTANAVRNRNTSNTLLRNAGVDLDLVGTQPFKNTTLRARIGFHSAEPVSTDLKSTDENVEETDPAPTDGGTTTPIGAVVEAAQAVAVGINFDYHAWTKDRFHLSLGLEASQLWANPDEFVFPSVLVDGERKPIEDVFSADEITRARNTLERVLPLGTLVLGPRMLFGRRDKHVFYTIGDLGVRSYQQRSFGIRYRVTPPTGTEPRRVTPIDILPKVEIRREWITRFGMGIRLSDAVDFKVDIVSPLGTSSNTTPVLRIMIASPDLRFGR